MAVRKCKITVVDFVRLYGELGSVRKVIRHVDMDESNFYKWKKRHQHEIDALMAARADSPGGTPSTLKQGNPVDIPIVLLNLLNKATPMDKICEALKTTPRVALAHIDDIRDQGYAVEESDGVFRLSRTLIPQENIYNLDWQGDKIIRFGLCGDMQMGSKYTQITYLHNFYDICAKEGIASIYNTGDITEGEEMRLGHKYECYCQGADAYLDEIVRNYPKRDGISTSFITGNHDHSLIKRAGYDIGKAIARERDDLKYLGQSYATIHLTPNCKMDIFHPTDGSAYALSYKIQKQLDGMQGGQKPNILAVGHYHKAEYLPIYRNVHAFQTGCFQAQTPFMRGHQLAAHVGGWIVEIHVDDSGTINRCKGEFVSYYNMIESDYKNWAA